MTELQNVRPMQPSRVQQRAEALPIQRGAVEYASALANEQWKLKAQLKAMVERGEIHEAYGWAERDGLVHAKFIRLRPARSKTPWCIAGITSALGAIVGVGVLIYHSRYVIMAAVGVALLVLLAIKLLAGHSAGCIGLHCSGCKG